MIEFRQSYVSEGVCYPTIEAAQHSEIAVKLASICGAGSINVNETASALVKHRDEFVDILTMSAKSRPRARKANGGRKPRKALTTAAPADSVAV